MSLTNQKAYESKKIVTAYRNSDGLQKAEKTILNIIKKRLSGTSMLDIGVGAGRTTVCFAPLVKKYFGIDYSAGMIDACRERFKDHLGGWEFKVCDVRSMEMLAENSFDFILFAYNGIDYISYDDREKAFEEIKRVSKPGGIFCFSAHNVHALRRFLKINLSLNPLRVFQALKRKKQVSAILKGDKDFKKISYAVISDGGEDFRVMTCYVDPKEQKKYLEQIGFRDICLFAETTGNEIMDMSDLSDISNERWIYYLCTNEKIASRQ
jgi:ubiquinone/menaquinone biosynthesis C-methylase UbiE